MQCFAKRRWSLPISYWFCNLKFYNVLLPVEDHVVKRKEEEEDDDDEGEEEEEEAEEDNKKYHL